MGSRGNQQPWLAGADRHDLTRRCRRVSLRQVNELHAQALLDRMHGTLGGFYAGTTGDVSVRELFTPDVTWHVPGHNAIAGDYLGIDEVLDYLARRRGIASGTFRMHPREILPGDQGHVGVPG
jgi:hypothetical protein